MELEHLISGFGSDPADPQYAFEYATQIHEFFKNPIDVFKLDQYLGLAFPENDGLTAFLRKRLTNKAFNASKLELLLMMKLILSNTDEVWKKATLPTCVTLKTLANMYWRNQSEPAKHQQIALDCLIALLDNYGEVLSESEFELGALYWDLLPSSEKSGFQPSVRGKIFHLLGLVANQHEALFKDPKVFSQLFTHIVTAVKTQVESKDTKIEVAILLGCLKAMDKILTRYGSKIVEASSEWGTFYTNLEQVIDPRCSIANDGTGQYQIKRREFQRAGLELIANNSKYFGKNLYRAYEQWYADLIVWSKSNNSDDNSVGRKAMYGFLESVAQYTKIEAEEMQTDSHGKFISYFLQTFQNILGSRNVSRSELLIAIKGIGLLSTSCANNTKQLDGVFEKIMDLVSGIVIELNSPVTDKYSGSLTLISAYLESIGSILPHITSLDEDGNISAKFLTQLNTIEQLSVQLITFYPDLSERNRLYAHNSIYVISNSLLAKHNHLCLPFVERIVSQALTHVISSPTRAELDILMESWNKTEQGPESKKSATSQLGLRGVKSYTQFWINLTSRECDPTVELVYDVIIQWILSTIGKLDLTFIAEDHNDEEEDDSTMCSGDITSSLTASVVKDFHLFVNLVEFFQVLVPKANNSLFQKWIEVFIIEMILLIEQNPLVSGFYKILTVTLNVTRGLEYFSLDLKDRQSLFQKCNEFMKGVTNKIKEFRDDLLLAVLELWLSAPDEIIIQNFNSLTSTLTIVFSMGRTCLGLAEHSIEAIDRWMVMEKFPREKMECLIQTLFPVWQTYFVTAGMESVYLEERALKKSNKKTKSKRQEKQSKQIREELDEVTLKKVQLKLLHILGSFGHILDFDHDVKAKNMLAQEDRFLKYAIPFQDIQPDIYLDTLLPRVLELCENSAERQIRASACEMLHINALYFLGYAVKSSGSTEGVELFTKMFRTIILLGCDGDVLVRQLFNPLAIQSVHWFTKSNNPHGGLILPIIMDGLVQSENAPLRDFSAACISEFFTWALKHDNKNQVTAVLNSIQALSTHAAPQYRLGAVVGFNSIYKKFRLEKELCNIHTICLFASFVTSLALSNGFEEDSLLIKTTKLAISHLERIMMKYNNTLFNIPLSGRKAVPDFPSKCPCLKDVVEWLIGQIGRKEVICRQESLRLVKTIWCHTKNVSLESFLVSIRNTNGLEHFNNLAERSQASCSLDCIDDLLQFLNAASEFYALLGSCNLLNSDIFESNGKSVFLSSYKALLQTPIDSINEKNWKSAMQVLCGFQTFREFFDDPIDELFLSFSIPSSQISFDNGIIVKLVHVWNTCKLTESVKLHLKSVVHLTVEDQLDEKPNSEVLKRVQWLTIVAENKFLQQLFSREDIKDLYENIWNVIEKNLYEENDSGGLQTVELSKSRLAVVEELLRLYLALDEDRHNVMNAMFDQRVVDISTSSLQKTTKGDIFQERMLQVLIRCDEMLEFSNLLQRCKIEKVGTIVEGFMTILKKNRNLRKEMKSKIFDKVIQSWSLLSVNCDSHTVARILSGLAALDMDKSKNSKTLSDWWSGTDLMSARHLDLKQKSEFIGFLGLFARSDEPEIVDQVIDTVRSVVVTDFNADIVWAELEGCITKIVLHTLLVLEKIPMNWPLLETLILSISKLSNIAGKNRNVPMFKEVSKRLMKVVQRFEQLEQTKFCSCVYKVILKYEDCSRNMTACKLFLIPALSTINFKAAREFFKKFILTIVKKASSDKVTLEEVNSKTVAFNLMEMMAHTTGHGFIKSTELLESYKAQLIGDGIDTSDAPNVLKEFTKAASRFKKSTISPVSDELLKSALLQCNQASYNALAVNLISTSDTKKVFEVFLISEDLRSNSNFLWSNIVDSGMQYDFPVVVDEKFGSGSITFSKLESVSKSVPFSSTQQQIGMSSRMNLAESSLASIGDHFDFTQGIDTQNTNQEGDIPTREKRPNSNIPEVNMEDNEVNRHDCMATFVATIRKLISLPNTADTCPDWVKHIQKVLVSSQHINIKIFVIGALLNCHEIISPYASYFVNPILSLITDSTGTNFGSLKLNYFVKDMIVMSLSWSHKSVPTDEMKRKILTYVIQNVELQDSSRKDIFKQNLEFVRKIVEIWDMNTESIPSNAIMDMLMRSEQLANGLAVCKQILVAGKLPFPEPEKLMHQFCRALQNSSKPIYCEAAENIGLLLKFLKDTNYKDREEAVKFIKRKITGEKSRTLQFVHILLHLKIYSPSEIIYFKSNVLEFLNSSIARAGAIQLLPNCFQLDEEINQSSNGKEAADNFFSDLAGRKLFSVPCTTVPEATTGLEILEALSSHMNDPDKLMQVLRWLNILRSTDSDGPVRARYCKCAMKIYKILKASENPRCTDVESEDEILRTFVQLYGDDDPHVTEVVSQFWSAILESINETPFLMTKLMGIVGGQENAIEITLGLILKRCSAAPSFNKNIFDKPLDDCVFFKYDLDTSWRMRDASFQPLFAESLSSSQNFATLPTAMQNSILSQRRNVGKFGVNLLRATLSLAHQQFTPTLQSVDSLPSQQMEVDDFHFFSQSNEDLTMSTDESPTQVVDPLASLRRRFFHRQDPGFFARKEVERQKGKIAASVEAVKMKRSNVKLCRSYRVGELPDILIKHCDLLKTVSTLAKLDDEIGRSFLVLLFTSMLEDIDRRSASENQHKSKSQDEIKNKTQEVIENLFRNFEKTMKPNFVAALLEISILNGILIQTSLVTNICSHFDLHELGILELEGCISDDGKIAGPAPIKRTKAMPAVAESEEVSDWLRIAEFYKDLEEYDVLRNIFSKCSTKSGGSGKVYERIRSGLSDEAIGKPEVALNTYSDLYEETTTTPAKYSFAVGKFVEDGLYNCLASLSDWEQLYDEIGKCKDRIRSDQILEDNEYLRRFLPHAVKSGLQIVYDEFSIGFKENNATRCETFQSLMLESGENFCQYLASQYIIEMASLLVSMDFHNTARGSALLEKGWEMGIKELQLFHRLSLPQRRERTLMLQQASVLQDILTWRKGIDMANIESRTETLMTKFKRLCNYKMASLQNCDIIVAQRSYFLKKIANLKAMDRRDDVVQKLKVFDCHQHLWVLSLAIRDKNVTIANKYLGKSKSLAAASNEDREWKKLYVHYLSTFHGSMPIGEWLISWKSGWKNVKECSSTKDIDIGETFQMQGELLRSLIEVTFGKEKEIKDKIKLPINKIILGDGERQGCSSIVTAATRGSSELIQKLSNHIAESKTDPAFVQMYQLLKLLLKLFPEQYGRDETMLRLMLNCLLRSMQSDQGEILLFFPSILTLLEKFPFLHQTFLDNVVDVPTWLFLPWLDQIITSYRNTNSCLQPVLSPILAKLKEMYPHAFQLQYTDFLTSSFIHEMYAKSLKALVLPSILHQKFIDELESSKRGGNLEITERLLKDFEEHLKTFEDSIVYGKVHTDYVREMLVFVKHAQDKLKGAKVCSERTSQMSSTNSAPDSQILLSLSNLAKCHQGSLQKLLKKKVNTLNLEDLSPWLAKFHYAISNEEVEIPGLYDRLGKPDVIFHPKVVSFYPTVTIFSSLTKPIRYTVLGNDGKRVDFLAKQGDDLRQDKRMQQLFRVSNKLFVEDCKTHKRKLHLLTYSVIPFTEEFGIIEMVNKTSSLASFILSSETLKNLKMKGVANHKMWINRTSGLESNANPGLQYYLKSAERANRGEAEKAFDSLASNIPRTLFVEHLLERARNLEKFFKIRQEMIRSYAAMCIVHWLLGIGDRHLENCLVSLETGQLVGIDFGRAFGTGNTALGIPEMIPFRLTPQLQNLMSPYGCKGLFKETMLHGWRCLIHSSELLLSIIEIFVNEINIDWLKDRKSQHEWDMPEVTGDIPKWKPLIVMESKLKCKNPLTILFEELASNKFKIVGPVYSKVVRDGREALLSKENFTEEEVVDALIDVATDKNVLCRHFNGLTSWI